MKYIAEFKTMTAEQELLSGGKGSSLVKMTKAGINVPGGVVILANAFQNQIFKEEALTEVNKYVESISDQYTYAVRSSALNEDGVDASFAGAYETVTNVKKKDIFHAIDQVLNSIKSARVGTYADSMSQEMSGIAVVIQKFVKPNYAGVLFTSDIITGSSNSMQGNYVCGEGEMLVSGQSNAKEFKLDVKNGKYHGPDEFKNYAHSLYKAAKKIRDYSGCPMDIEWAVSNKQLYLLQARPVTTLKRLNKKTYQINGSYAGEFLLSKTNVGEIFMCPVSPITFGILESICELLGCPCFIDNICGQAYCNVSVVCSMLVSFGFSKEKAYSMIADLAGTIPKGVEIPIFPFDRKTFLRKIKKLITGRKNGKKKSKKEIQEFLEDIPNLSRIIISTIHKKNTNQELFDYWNYINEDYLPKIMQTISTLFPLLGSFLNTGKKVARVAGEELGARIIAGSSGILESMKPLLYLEEVMQGEMSEENYIQMCGHRSVNEMELAQPYPYEDPSFVKLRIEEHRKSGMNVHKMQEQQEEQYKVAIEEFNQLYPKRKQWLQKQMSKYINANRIRESIRSKAVWLFCVLREFLKQTAKVNSLGEDVFMLYFDEVLRLLKGEQSVLQNISLRRKNYDNYCNYPQFPNVIVGRFEPEQWMKDEHRRMDCYIAGQTVIQKHDITGYAGAAGVVTGNVRVINNLSEAEQLIPGEILVTNATNIGWTIIFPKAAAIVTDIGAPLSHAAIVAREFGIPAVVGCGNATTLLHTGERVIVNGSLGIVTIVA